MKLLQNNRMFVEFNETPNAIPVISESSMVIGDINLPITIISAFDYEPIYYACLLYTSRCV